MNTIEDPGIARALKKVSYAEDGCIDEKRMKAENSPDGQWRAFYHVYLRKTHYIVDLHDDIVHICESRREAHILMRDRYRKVKNLQIAALQ